MGDWIVKGNSRYWKSKKIFFLLFGYYLLREGFKNNIIGGDVKELQGFFINYVFCWSVPMTCFRIEKRSEIFLDFAKKN